MSDPYRDVSNQSMTVKICSALTWAIGKLITRNRNRAAKLGHVRLILLVNQLELEHDPGPGSLVQRLSSKEADAVLDILS